MEMTPLQQAANLIRGAKNVLLLSTPKPDGDGLGSCLALHLALLKLGKRATTYAAEVPEMYRFLPRLDLVTSRLPGGRDFIITLNTTQTQVEKVQFQQRDGHLDLILTPSGGTFSAADITTRQGEESFDLIVVPDTGELRLVGSILEERRELFQHTPILVVDHHITNERFGQVNLVDVSAAAASELIYRLLEELAPGGELLDADVATCILNGLITDTGSFQHSNTTPRSFELAATLLAAGARQQEIIRHVFKTKEFSMLKLWGVALEKLRYEPDIRLVWTGLTRQDFAATKSNEQQTGGLIDDLLSSAPEAAFVMLLREDGDGVLKGSLRAVSPTVDVAALCALFGGGGHTKAAGFKVVGGSVEGDAPRIIDAFREALAKLPVPVVAAGGEPADPAVLPEVAKQPL